MQKSKVIWKVNNSTPGIGDLYEAHERRREYLVMVETRGLIYKTVGRIHVKMWEHKVVMHKNIDINSAHVLHWFPFINHNQLENVHTWMNLRSRPLQKPS